MSDILAQYLLMNSSRRQGNSRSRFADALLQQGASTAPVHTPLEGLARALTGAVGGWQARRADEEDRERETGEFERLRGYQEGERARQAEEVRNTLAAFGIALPGGGAPQGAPGAAPTAAMPQAPQPGQRWDAGLPGVPAAPQGGGAGVPLPPARQRGEAPLAVSQGIAARAALDPNSPTYAEDIMRVNDGVVARTMPGQAMPRPAGAAMPPPMPPGGATGPNFEGAALAAALSQNPTLARAAPMLAQMGRREAPNMQTAAPGSAIIDPRTGQVVGQIPERPTDTQREMAEWERLARLPNRDPIQQQQMDILRDRLTRQGVTVNMAGDNTYDRERGQAIAATIADTEAAGPRAAQRLRQLDQMERLAQDAETGVFANTRLTVGQVARQAGISDEVLRRFGMAPDQVANAETFRSLSSQMLVGMIGPGGFPAQAFSNADREMLERALPSLMNSPQGNRLMIQIARAGAQRELAIANAWTEWSRINGDTRESARRFNLEVRPRLTQESVIGPILEGASLPPAPANAGPRGMGIAEPPVMRAAPAPGTIMQGYRFRGGDPANPGNWERVQ